MGIFTDPFINWKRVRHYGIIAAIVWILAVFLLLDEYAPAPKRVVLVVVDGLRADAIAALGQAQAPNFTYLINTGASTMNARTEFRSTETLPNIVSMLTGRPAVDSPVAHKNVINAYTGRSIHDYIDKYIDSVFDVVHQAGRRSSFFAAKDKLGIFIKSYNNSRYVGEKEKSGKDPARIQSYVITHFDDKKTLLSFLEELVYQKSSFMFLHLAGPDRVGHRDGWNVNPDSLYMKEVKLMDGYLGQIIKTIKKYRRLRTKTYLIVTTDHGGTGPGHSDIYDPLNYTVPFIVWGPDVARGQDLYELNKGNRREPGRYLIGYETSPQPIRNAEAGNLALELIGLPPIPNSLINGLQSLRVKGQGGNP
jgi:predicted AlkP superfamily pyrophosphatase or phosphodiesterase